MQSLDDLFLSNILNSSLGIQRINYNHRVIDSTWTKVFEFNFLLLQILTFHFSCNLWIPKDNAENFGRIRNMIALQRKWISFLTFKKEKNDAKCKFLIRFLTFDDGTKLLSISLKIISFSSYRFIDHKYPHHTRCPNKFWTLLKISKFHKRLVTVCLLSG